MKKELQVNEDDEKCRLDSFIAKSDLELSRSMIQKLLDEEKITVNNKDIDEAFGVETLKVIVKQPLVATNSLDKYDVIAKVTGGGISGQAGAVRHGIARALIEANAEYRPTLKSAGFLTRDARMKERKKYGLKKARKAPQFSKR